MKALYLCKVIHFNQFNLKNGLRCLHFLDTSRTNAVLNILYNVGARDEKENKTGFAHLFEHLMFGGSVNVEHYDKEIEKAGGSNNAYTTNFLTNYYIHLPVENIETACWLESDRMLQLNFNPEVLETQRSVVIEEFKQRCFNAPFGMLWHHARELLYESGSYRWPTIGADILHIETATMNDVKSFYNTHYHPANAVLCIAGNIELNEAQILIEKWFGSIEKSGEINKNVYFQAPKNTERKIIKTTDLSPNNVVVLAWRGPGVENPDSLNLECFAELFGATDTSPLYLQLVKKNPLFSQAASFYSRNHGEGIFMIYGILNNNVSHETAEQEILLLLDRCMKDNIITESELEQRKNKTITQLLFEKTNLMSVAEKLCFYELFGGGANNINFEEQELKSLRLDAIKSTALATFDLNSPSVIYYSPLQ